MSQIFNPSAVSFFEMKGPDAQDFLHRLTTIDVKNLQAGETVPGFFLNPQGKVRAYLWLGCLEKGHYFIEIEDDSSGQWKKEFLAVVDQFTFAEKYELKELSELKCVWILEDPALKSAMDEKRFLRAEDCYWINHGCKTFGRPWLSIWGDSASIEVSLRKDFPNAVQIGESGLDLHRIQALGARVGHELKLDSNPLELGMKDAIADQKGCYPGQEVIEKIIALGSPARRLVQLSGKGSLNSTSPGQKITTPDGAEIGETTSLHLSTDNEWLALGIVRKTHAKEKQPIQLGGAAGEITRLTQYA